MTEREEIAFADALEELATLFQRTLEPKRIRAYFRALRDLNLGVVLRALDHAAQHATRFPLPGQIREHMRQLRVGIGPAPEPSRASDADVPPGRYDLLRPDAMAPQWYAEECHRIVAMLPKLTKAEHDRLLLEMHEKAPQLGWDRPLR